MSVWVLTFSVHRHVGKLGRCESPLARGIGQAFSGRQRGGSAECQPEAKQRLQQVRCASAASAVELRLVQKCGVQTECPLVRQRRMSVVRRLRSDALGGRRPMLHTAAPHHHCAGGGACSAFGLRSGPAGGMRRDAEGCGRCVTRGLGEWGGRDTSHLLPRWNCAVFFPIADALSCGYVFLCRSLSEASGCSEAAQTATLRVLRRTHPLFTCQSGGVTSAPRQRRLSDVVAMALPIGPRVVDRA